MGSLASAVDCRQSSIPEIPELQLVSSCKPEKISSMFSSFQFEKANLLNSIGFGGLLKLPRVEKLNLELILWLYQRFDFNNLCLHLDGGVDLHIRCPDVHLIFGIPFEGVAVNPSLFQSEDTINAFKHKLFAGCTAPSLTISFLEQILSKQYGCALSPAERIAFNIATVLYAATYLLAPELHHDFPMHLIDNFLPDADPSQLNWAYIVLSTLGRASSFATSQLNKGCKKISLFGCGLLLQVFYLDNLNFGPSTPHHSFLPRASAYLPDVMSNLIQSDSNGTSNGKFMFGKREVRRAFDVCYTRGWQINEIMQTALEPICEDDYLSSIEILSQGIQLIDKFATQLNKSTFVCQNAGLKSVQDLNNFYLHYRSKFQLKIHSLSRKAAELIKMRNLSLYHKHIPRDIPCTSQSRVYIGTSNRHLFKRSNLSKVQHLRSCTRNKQLALSQVIISRHHADEGSSSSSSQIPYSQRKSITSHSNFPVSPFELMFTHPDVTWENKYRSYSWITNPSLPFEELNRNWIVFNVPNQLSLSGHLVQHCLKLNGSFTVSMVDAIMVLWNYLDLKVYNHFQPDEQEHMIWRHFLPASFADTVIQNNDYLNSDAIRHSFIGDHITYNVQDCQKIIIPVYANGETWSCYFWDFKLKTITVLDPLLMRCPDTEAREKHHDIVFKLHNALFACKDHFFSGWDVKDHGWVDFYPTNLGRRCKPQNSGLFAVHYARAFDGTKLAFNLKDPLEASLCEARGEIAYQMFTCADNLGYKPNDLMEKLSYFKL